LARVGLKSLKAETRRGYSHQSEFRQADAEELRIVLLAAAPEAEARLGIANPYGQRYIVDFDLVRQDRTVKVRSAWIVRIGEDLPRLTSCYVL